MNRCNVSIYAKGPDYREYYQERRLSALNLLRPLVSVLPSCFFKIIIQYV